MGRAITDPDFRQRMLDNPVSALREDVGLVLPDGFKLFIHEDNGVDEAHIVIPPTQFSAEEMAQVAAGNCDGTGYYAWDC